jgi:hypothetical protein
MVGQWWPMQPMLAKESRIAKESAKSSAKVKESSIASPQKVEKMRQNLNQNCNQNDWQHCFK